MALNNASLKSGIQSLAQNIAGSGGSYADFASGLADLIDDYVKSGIVTVAAGIAVSVTGSPSAQAGATTAPGTGTIS